MSREIEFRAWDRASVAGRTVKVTPLQFNDWLNVNGTGGADGIHYILMQLTGLHDMYSVEIYEGDILTELEQGKIVEWIEEGAGWQFRPVKGTDADYSAAVVGNIHENPDLRG